MEMSCSSCESDYDFFMLLIENSVSIDTNPFDGIEKDTVERGIRGQNGLAKDRIKNVLKNQDNAKLIEFINRNYSEFQQYNMERKIQNAEPDFNGRGDFAFSCSDLFYQLMEEYIKPASKKAHSAPISIKNKGNIDTFETRYRKPMSISSINSGIKTKLFDSIDYIICVCQRFQAVTNILHTDIEILNKAKNSENIEQFQSYVLEYDKHCDEVCDLFNKILRMWGRLYSKFGHIIEIDEISRINFAHPFFTPDNKLIHVAGDNTDSYIEKLRNFAEDHLFT